MLSMKQGSIIKGWGYHWISLFIPCRVNITCSPNILMLPDSYEAQLSEYIQLSHKQCVYNLYWTMGSRGQVRSRIFKGIRQKAKNRQDSKFKMKNDAREITGYYRAPFVSFTSGSLNGRKRFGRGR